MGKYWAVIPPYESKGRGGGITGKVIHDEPMKYYQGIINATFYHDKVWIRMNGLEIIFLSIRPPKGASKVHDCVLSIFF